MPMPTVKITLSIVLGTAAHLCLAVLGWGGFRSFFSHPAVVAFTIALSLILSRRASLAEISARASVRIAAIVGSS